MPRESESSDDEGEASVTTVFDYRFEDENDLPVSFSVLPLRAVGNDTHSREISLYGTMDNGLRKISKQVVAWNYDLSAFVSGALISVLSKEGKWIVLGGKPLKWYGNGEARSILVTLACLHFIRRNPEISNEALWNHLAKIFSFFNVKPNSCDFIPHVDLIADAVKSDCFLSQSEFLRSFLQDPEKIANQIEPKVVSKFIVDDTVDYDYELSSDENEELEEGELYDSVCAFCDNGGFVLCCDGVCMRAFHAKGEAGARCEGIGLSKREIDVIQTFVCKNCKYKQHQCFCCGKLGISDKSKGPEVFQCFHAFCGHFYHPQCIAKLLKQDDEPAQELLIKRISEGESFTCTIHKCATCQGGEKKNEIDYQFAVCRRCPTAYHRKCVPREIHFAKTDEDEENEEEDDGIIFRAWENLWPNRVLIYCLKHDIIEELGTPPRGHVIFPEVDDSKANNALERPRRTATLKRKSYNEASLQTKRQIISEKSSSPFKRSKASENKGISGSLRNTLKVYKTPLKRGKSLPPKRERSRPVDTTTNFVDNKPIDNKTRNRKRDRHIKPHDSKDSTSAEKISESLIHNNANLLTEESKRRVMTLMNKSELEVSLDGVLSKRQIPSVYSHSSKNMIDNTITLEKVEGAVETARAALNKVKNGSSIDEAQAVCKPEVLNQIFKWQRKLNVYLSPFLHGSRYTSYGRHFTKVEKLEEIANILHPYVQSGDMIVDFCCGANDFSCVMRKKLKEHGKKCLFKNYDVIQPKNASNFQKRDWMTVEPHELIDGGRLIIGLNPCFGVKAALANKFIDKALQFNPKLLILIVPNDAERPSQKSPPYDLIWENSAFCSCKSFYLPGSEDDNDAQLDQWNSNAPNLVMWSRRDWTRKHTSIAKIHSHLLVNEKNVIDVVHVDDEDVFVEKRTDNARTLKKSPPENASESKPPAHVSVPRGSVSPHFHYNQRDVGGAVNVEEDDLTRQICYSPRVPHGISVDSCPHPPLLVGHNVNYKRGFSPYNLPYGNEQVPRLGVPAFPQQFGNSQQNPGVPHQLPYPNWLPGGGPGLEHTRRISATERYASQLNDLSFNVGGGRVGAAPAPAPAPFGPALLRQQYNGDFIQNPHPYSSSGNPYTWHKDHNPPMRNNL